jgi:hypothetical protein
MEIEWLAEDLQTLAHTSKLTISGKSAVTPQVAQTSLQAPPQTLTKVPPQASKVAQVASPQRADTLTEQDTFGFEIPKNALVVVGESLTRQTVGGLGKSAETTDALISRLKSKVVPDRINLVYPRVPFGSDASDHTSLPIPPLSRHQIAALVDVQLEVDGPFVIPPLQSGLDNLKQFEIALDRTIVSVQTFRSSKEIVGYFPRMEAIDIIPDMVEKYVKAGVHFFAVDLAGASNAPSQMRMIVFHIRQRLKIGKRSGEKSEKYYLHVFNVATARKSIQPVAPISDIITHPYGVDSTSGVMWGGGQLETPKLRYYSTSDYGHYRPAALGKLAKSCSCPTCSGSSFKEIYSAPAHAVFRRLRRHRLFAYAEECGRISERINAGEPVKSYWPYLTTKPAAASDIAKIMRDVKEIRANLR